MGLLGNGVKWFLEGGLPQTVEGCDREILKCEKAMIDQKRWGNKNAVDSLKKDILDLREYEFRNSQLMSSSKYMKLRNAKGEIDEDEI